MRAGAIIAGRFEVRSLAGEGGAGVVYQTRDRLTGELAALKVLRFRDSAGEQRLGREARILAELSHPSIVRHLSHGATPDGMLYLAMEWLEGATLSALLEAGRLPAADAVAIALQVASALEAAHQKGIVHRDIKPSNIVIEPRRGDAAELRVKVLDFGVAHLFSAGQRLTATGAVLGTPGYMAPEQARGEPLIDARADVFALGCVLYEALSGQRAFAGEDVLTVLLKLALEEAPRLRSAMPEADPRLDELLRRMMAKDPAERPASCGAVREALAPLERGAVKVESAPPPISASERRWISAALIRPVEEPDAEAWASLAEAVERHGGRLDRLADGSAVAVVALSGLGAGAPDAATDLAARSARCALSAREILPSPSVALVTGRSDRRGAIGDLLGHGVALLRGAAVRVDEATRHLLDTRFEVNDAGVLEGERDEEADTRTLLQQPVRFVGRGRELTALSAMFEESESGPVAQAAIVLGPPGIGKSRLRQELIAALRRRPQPPRVWLSRGDATSAGSPFGMLSRALRREAAICDGEPPAAQRARLEARFGRSLLPQHRARTLAFVGELCNVPLPGDLSADLRAARDNPMLMGDHIHRAFEDLIAAEYAAEPLVIVLEDLHWGDRPSVDLIDGVLRNLPDHPIFVLALSRPELTAVFPDLWAERRVQTLRLGELLPKQSEALVRSVLGDRIDGAALTGIVQRAGGNAFFLEELVRSFAEGKRDHLPETVLAMLGARIEQLDAPARRVLRAASLFGQTFWVEGVRALLGDTVTAAALDAVIELCVRRELLVRRRASRLAGQREVAFRHALVRDAAAAMLAEETLGAGHLRVAEWLEQAGEHDMLVLAEHFEKGGDLRRAMDAYRRAAAQALEGNDFAASIDAAERAAAVAKGEALGVLRRLQAEAHGWRDEHAQAMARGREAMSLLAAGSAGWCAAAVEIVRGAASLADKAALEAMATEIGALSPSEPQPHHLTAAARIVGYLFGADLRAHAERVLERAERLASLPGAVDPTSLPWLQHARSWAAFFAGDVAGSLRHEELAVAGFDAINDARQACYMRVGLGHAYRDVGAYPEAERILREGMRSAERLGIKRIALGAKHTLSTILPWIGQLAEAMELARAAISGFAAEGDIRMTGGSRTELSRLLAEAGDLEAAEAEARAALRGLDSCPSAQAHAFGMLSHVQRLAGKSAEALAAARAAMLILAEAGAIQDGEIFLRLAFAEALHAAGDAQAPRALAAVRDCVLAKAARIEDPALKAGFLRNIPEHTRALALAEERLKSIERARSG